MANAAGGIRGVLISISRGEAGRGGVLIFISLSEAGPGSVLIFISPRWARPGPDPSGILKDWGVRRPAAGWIAVY